MNIIYYSLALDLSEDLLLSNEVPLSPPIPLEGWWRFCLAAALVSLDSCALLGESTYALAVPLVLGTIFLNWFA